MATANRWSEMVLCSQRLRSTAVVSMSTRSGRPDLRRHASPLVRDGRRCRHQQSRSRAHSRPARSTPGALLGEIAGRTLKPDHAACTPLYSPQYLAEARPLSDPHQLLREVLLKRLTLRLGRVLEGGMHIVG